MTVDVCCIVSVGVMFAFFVFQDDITSLDAERQTLYLQIYRPVYFQLVDVLLQKACFPTDEDYRTWSADDKEQFRTYRLNHIYFLKCKIDIMWVLSERC